MYLRMELCERLQLLAVCVNRIVNVHICMPISAVEGWNARVRLHIL